MCVVERQQLQKGKNVGKSTFSSGINKLNEIKYTEIQKSVCRVEMYHAYARQKNQNQKVNKKSMLKCKSDRTFKAKHPEATSMDSDICNFSKNSDLNGGL